MQVEFFILASIGWKNYSLDKYYRLCLLLYYIFEELSLISQKKIIQNQTVFALPYL